MFILYLIIFSYPTDDSGWIPRCDSVCSKSLIRDGEGRMSRALRRLQCFIRLGMMSIDLVEIMMYGQEGARCWAQYRDQDVYEVNELIFFRSSAQLFIHTNYLGPTKELVCADLVEVHQRTIVNHNQLCNVTAYSNLSHCLAASGSNRNRSTIKASVGVYAKACDYHKYHKHSCVSMLMVIKS